MDSHPIRFGRANSPAVDKTELPTIRTGFVCPPRLTWYSSHKGRCEQNTDEGQCKCIDASRHEVLVAVSPAPMPIPAAIADCGERASERFFTFFTDTIRNKNTRAAYYRNAMRFFAWASVRQVRLTAIKSYHVSAYLEEKERVE
jgi:hypothetical protein